MQIFDEIRGRGVEDVLFISMDSVSSLEEGARSIFKDVVVQRCIVHLTRNSIKYIPSRDYKAYTAQLKRVYEAPSLKAAEAEFERFKQAWSQYPGAIEVWVRNWTHVEQPFNIWQYREEDHVYHDFYRGFEFQPPQGNEERLFSQRGCCPKSAIPTPYGAVQEMGKPIGCQLGMVRNQLSMNTGMQTRIMKYEKY